MSWGLSNWPEIPEVGVTFKECEDGFKADVLVDLGVLGKWEIGEFTIIESDPVEVEKQKTEVKVEVQHAFNRLLLRVAAAALIKQDSCLPVIGWYAHALVETHGEEEANKMIDSQLAEMLKYRQDGIGLHEM